MKVTSYLMISWYKGTRATCHRVTWTKCMH